MIPVLKPALITGPVTFGERFHARLVETVVVYMCLRAAWLWGLYLPQIERAITAHGVGYYVGLSALHGPYAAVLLPALISGLILAGYLRLHRFAYLGAVAALHVLFAARFVLGKAPHGGMLPGTILLMFGLAAVCFSDADERRRFAMGAAVFFTGLAYVLSAASKLVASGPGWISGDHLWLWIAEKQVDVLAATGFSGVPMVQQLVLDHYLLATALLAGGLLCEMGGFLLWWRRTRPLIAVALIGMHLGIIVVMSIDFRWFIMLLATIGLPWDAWLNRMHRRLPRHWQLRLDPARRQPRAAPGAPRTVG